MRMSNMPEWLRWVLFIPVAVVALAVVYPIVQFGNDLLSPVDHGVLFQLFKIVAASGASGFAFIWCGATIAPRKQFLIATIMTSLYILLSVLLLLARILVKGVDTTPWIELIGVTVVGSAGAILACIMKRDQERGTNHGLPNIKLAASDTMKRILKGICIAVVALVVIAFALNGFVRVSHSPTRSIGIIEELLFGRPAEEALAPPWSEDYKRWDSASKASASVADLLQKFGAVDLTTREDLAEQRKQAEHLSKLAFESAGAVSRAYLGDSNADLPDAYFEHFVPAMDFWRHGFADKNPAVVRQGISNYNAFLVWMQSRDRSDFRPMR